MECRIGHVTFHTSLSFNENEFKDILTARLLNHRFALALEATTKEASTSPFIALPTGEWVIQLYCHYIEQLSFFFGCVG